jgi:hypothetical protein
VSPAEVKGVEKPFQTITVPSRGPGTPRHKPERLIPDRGDKALFGSTLASRPFYALIFI